MGLAPGRRGANRTGLAFSGDDAGAFLLAALVRAGVATACAQGGEGDGFALRDCLVTNAVRCAPPGNRPTAAEIAACRPFLAARLAAMPRLRVVLALGRVAHDSVARALGAAPAAFAHGAERRLGRLLLIASFHPSRLNTNTGRLTADMLDAALRSARHAVRRAETFGTSAE